MPSWLARMASWLARMASWLTEVGGVIPSPFCTISGSLLLLLFGMRW